MITKEDAVAISGEIIRQFGGNRFKLMTGAKNFGYSILDNGDVNLTFKIGKNAMKVSHVSVTLNANDTYHLEFLRVNIKTGRNVLKEFKHVYCDQLEELFQENAGLYTRL